MPGHLWQALGRGAAAMWLNPAATFARTAGRDLFDLLADVRRGF